jgi:hypothetical protein
MRSVSCIVMLLSIGADLERKLEIELGNPTALCISPSVSPEESRTSNVSQTAIEKLRGCEVGANTTLLPNSYFSSLLF